MKLKSIFVYFTYLFFCVSFLSFFWLVSSVGSFCAGRGWRIQNKPVISSEIVSHILLFRKRNQKIWLHCLGGQPFSGFFGICAQPRVVLVLFLKRLLKICLVLCFREAKANLCIFHFVVFVLVESFSVGLGWGGWVPNKQVESAMKKVSHSHLCG